MERQRVLVSLKSKRTKGFFKEFNQMSSSEISTKQLEFLIYIDYNISEKESTHSKSGCLNGIVSTL